MPVGDTHHNEPAAGALSWVILTRGDRDQRLAAAVESVQVEPVFVVANGATVGTHVSDHAVVIVETAENVGIPAGRGLGAGATESPLIGFLDDDAVAAPGIGAQIIAAFQADPSLGAVSLRLVDEQGTTARRHVPRFGGRHPERSGDVALFLGGACALRREAYDDAGGYWGELFYGHEEVELAWRLIDHGWRIRYLPDATVFHPRSEIGRHADGWRMTGRNRVMIARRTLPWPIALLHVSGWFVLGLIRAPGQEHRSAYRRGWMSGWSQPVDRQPIRWLTVWRLTRLGRPPIL